MTFLDRMSRDWNISLFHYRNQGADYDRILAGNEVPPGARGDFKRFVTQLGYPAQDETGNLAFKLFLQPVRRIRRNQIRPQSGA